MLIFLAFTASQFLIFHQISSLEEDFISCKNIIYFTVKKVIDNVSNHKWLFRIFLHFIPCFKKFPRSMEKDCGIDSFTKMSTFFSFFFFSFTFPEAAVIYFFKQQTVFMLPDSQIFIPQNEPTYKFIDYFIGTHITEIN